MKKILAGIMSLTLMGALLTGCGADTGTSSAGAGEETSAVSETTAETTEENTDDAAPSETEEQVSAEADALSALTDNAGSDEMLKLSSDWISADTNVKDTVSAADYGDTSKFSMSDYYESQSIDGSMEMMALFMPVTADVKSAKDSEARYFNIDMHIDFSSMAEMFGALSENGEADASDIPSSIDFNYSAKVDNATGETIVALPSIKKYAKVDAAEAGIDLSSYENIVPDISDPLSVTEVEHNGEKMYRVIYSLPSEAEGFSMSTDAAVCGLKMSDDDKNPLMYVWFGEDYKIKAFCSAPMGMTQFVQVNKIGGDVDAASVFSIEGYEEISAEEMASAVASEQGGL